MKGLSGTLLVLCGVTLGMVLAGAAGRADSLDRTAPSPEEPAAGEEKTEEPPQMSQYFVGLIYMGDHRDANTSQEDIMEIQRQHLDNISRLHRQGKMVMAGPFGHGGELRGLFFYDVETLEEAEELAQTDPAVKAGRLRVDIYPWWGPTALKTLVPAKVE